MPEAADEELIVLLRSRDERGFDLAYARYAQRIFSFLVRLSRSRSLAEDLFLHTFLRLAECGPGLRPGSDLRAWLFSVARNAFHSHARARQVASRVDLPILQGGAPRPEVGLELADLEKALFSLSSQDRELLLLVAVEGLSQIEVARMLGIDPMAVRKRVSRARERLAAVLAGDRAPLLGSEAFE